MRVEESNMKTTEKNNMLEVDILFKEIDLVESCINRMAANSFEIKKWTVGIIAILAGLIKQDVSVNDCKITILFLMVILIFWWLDAFFLKMERLYRKKYSWLIKERIEGNMNDLFNLNPYNKAMMLDSEKCMPSHICVMFSRTLCPFYFGLAIFCIIIFR